MKKIKQKILEIRELVNFCDDYNSIGYGGAKLIELKNSFIVELYNAGFSENELMDESFRTLYKNRIIYNRHPMMVAEFPKLSLFLKIVNFGNIKDWCDCYELQKEYVFKIEIS